MMRDGDVVHAHDTALWPTGRAARLNPIGIKEHAEHLIQFVECDLIDRVVHPTRIDRIALYPRADAFADARIRR